MRRTGHWVPPDPDPTGEVPMEEPHKHSASCHGAVGEILCGHADSTTEKVDQKAPVWFAFAFFALVLVLCGSGTIWVLVKIWRDILA